MGFTMDNSYVALDVDMWCPDVLVMVVVVCVWWGCSCWGGGGGGGGGVCVSRYAFEFQ